MKFAWVVGVCAACIALAGCGSAEPSRTPLQGKVTYEGKPVAYGVINFTPDSPKGNKGVFGVAEIHNGVFQTNPDYAPTLGPMFVSFQVYDAEPPNNKLIANIRDYTVEIPPGSSNWDFQLTAKDIKPTGQ